MEPGAAQSVDTVATLRVARPACIPPGTYRFRVTAQNNDGVWNPAGATVDIVLEPHFYQRRLFYAACTAGLLFGSVGLFRLRVRRIQALAAALERTVAARTSELQLEVAERRRADAKAVENGRGR